MSNAGKNDAAWQQLFDKYAILPRVEQDGAFTISANQIREFREPRLMAKFDHRLNLPEQFRKHRLAILPVSRGEYVISHFDCFMPLSQSGGDIRRMKFPESIQSIDPNNITSEAVALNSALASGIFNDFLEEETLIPTVSGRMGSGAFHFDIDNKKTGAPVTVQVNNAQIEIDAALEGRASLTLVEAKCDLSDDFIIRQLFYPYKTWQNRVSKTIRLLYVTFSNGIFAVNEYAPADPTRYNSLRLIQSRRYSVDDTEIDMEDIEAAFRTTPVAPEPELPFPQADSFERVINLCELLQERARSKDDVTENYDFDARQTDYYTAAGRYLGLVEKDRSDRPMRYRLTRRAQDLFKLRYRQRQLQFCRCILEHEIFHNVFAETLRAGRIPEIPAIVEQMKRANLYHIKGDTTYTRRASTIRGWLEWILALRTQRTLLSHI